jgi:hypothetical protein
MKRIINIVVIAILAGALITLFILFKQYNKPHTDVYSSPPAYKVTTNITEEFKNDEEKANDTYLDKIIQVEGIIESFDTANGNGIIVLGSGNSMENIICNMDPSENRNILSLQKGQKITIKGICTGYLLDVVLVGAVIVK